MKALSWILQIVVASAFFISANLKLASFAAVEGHAPESAYPMWWLYLVATLELLGAIGLLIPRLVQTAASVLIVLMLGAVYTSFVYADSLAAALPAIALLVLLAFILLLQRGILSATSL